ncbi:Gfo/Idh/MocA family protein [Alicyclobacillus fastidiosus]|uniref:Gfo/Idh/MocA family protein n=1 Tax=Alicyclobacillus fastidiosus TaxID=392011 RepID=UPI0023E90F8B|nr:dehydrogenase [Alicyclobacillus fastidiosus]
MPNIKVGVIGTGFIGPAHVEAIRRLGFVEVVAIAGSSLESARRAANHLSIPKAYGDYRDLLQDPEVQVVHNCTPNHLHYSVNLDIIKAGKHVMSEKPLAVSRTQTRTLLEQARQKGIVHGVCFNYRQYPMVQHLKSLVLSRALGDVRLIRGNYLQDWLSSAIDYNWRIDPKLGGPVRAVGDIGSHWMDTVQYITGQRITEVYADLVTVLPVRKKRKTKSDTFSHGSKVQEDEYEDIHIASEDYGTILFRFSGGATGVVTVSQITPGRKNHLLCEIDCSESSALWNQEQSEQLWIGHRNKPNEMVMADPALLSEQAQPFLHYPVATIKDGRTE